MRATVVGAALAASLALALLFATNAGLGPTGEPAAQVAEKPIGSAEEIAQTGPENEALAENPDVPPAASESRIAETETPEVAPLPEAPASEQADEPTPADRPGVLIAASPPLIEETAPSAPVTPEAEVEEAIEEIELAEPMLVAMNLSGPLVYAPPPGSTPLEYLGSVRSPTSDLPMPQALAPPHIAKTLDESPTLYWYLPTATDARVEFVLADRVSLNPVLELTLDSPVSAGIHATRLRDHAVVLDPEVEYRWFVSVSREADPSAELVTRGGIERIAPGPGLDAKLAAAEPGDLGRVYAESGLWYDAIATVSEAIERAPQESKLRALRAGLLEQVGLREAADYDRRSMQAGSSP